MNIKSVFASAYAQEAFVLSLAIGYFLIPSQVFADVPILALAFLLSFALSISCTVRALKENIKANKSHGIIAILSSIFGFAALSACSLSLSCAAAGFGIFAFFAHLAIANSFLIQYAPYAVALSIIIQLLAVWKMGCFGKSISKPKKIIKNKK